MAPALITFESPELYRLHNAAGFWGPVTSSVDWYAARRSGLRALPRRPARPVPKLTSLASAAAGVWFGFKILKCFCKKYLGIGTSPARLC